MPSKSSTNEPSHLTLQTTLWWPYVPHPRAPDWESNTASFGMHTSDGGQHPTINQDVYHVKQPLRVGLHVCTVVCLYICASVYRHTCSSTPNHLHCCQKCPCPKHVNNNTIAHNTPLPTAPLSGTPPSTMSQADLRYNQTHSSTLPTTRWIPVQQNTEWFFNSILHNHSSTTTKKNIPHNDCPRAFFFYHQHSVVNYPSSVASSNKAFNCQGQCTPLIRAPRNKAIWFQRP